MNFDFVIVGAGSAGCLLANRLSADGQFTVCLLEAGGDNKSFFVSSPAGVSELMKSEKMNWLFDSVPQKTQQDRKIFCPRGKGMGGSSAVNGMMYVRGHAKDYDRWADEGADGWSYKEVLPYFKKSEHQERGADEWHGTEGELNVTDAAKHYPFNDLYIEAARGLGYPVTDDFNGEQQEGVGYYQYNIRNGRRDCSAEAFVRPIEGRQNLTVITHAHACGIEWEGIRATGVTYLDKSGSKLTVGASREVILSGGAFNSPQLLMLSGVGDKGELAEHHITVKHHLPGVGKNLQEHVDALVVRNAKPGKSGPFALRPKVFLKELPYLLSYPFLRKGLLAGAPGENGGFFKSSEDKDIPDLQWVFIPSKVNEHGRDLRFMMNYGYSAHVALLRPKSRGEVSLFNSNPLASPKIDLNMLSHPDDVRDLTFGVRATRKLLAASAFSEFMADEVYPGEGCQSDEAIEEFLRRKANHIYHPVGTCKMGVDDMAVVDPRLKVHGLQNLRVVDASVMPSIIGGNTNAPTYMIAEKASDMILQDNAP